MTDLRGRLLGAVVASLVAVIASGCGGSGSDGGKVISKAVDMGETIVAKGANGTASVDMTVDAEEGTPEDLADFRLEADEAKMTPWYVRLTQENTGSKPIGPDNPVPVVVTVADDSGLEARKIGLIGDFEKCALVNAPSPFPVGEQVKSCSVYLVPKGATLKQVRYSETRFEGANRVYLWKAG